MKIANNHILPNFDDPALDFADCKFADIVIVFSSGNKQFKCTVFVTFWRWDVGKNCVKKC